ncbi:MAG: bifunctional phosphoribosylaminoimidazolecarboxamide formyltransferase/IMP cyclohydrolase [Spirochaetes bacterium]|nr:bifunctional phosphoribosylaminoimidazolecarboxamide formyltransferase/IMP cyclohydrolase [Spirochaetota bacterium]MBU1081904.1 bifunctional phosphoribosylaminoimidazolecarboxamide formyltransferase/IMP cyclohydrolase [Spirochaetota bacterium]
MMTALISVSDKTGLAEFAGSLASSGWSLVASGGTAKALAAAGVAAMEVSAYTGSPEILGGRVKTLHPAIHGGILSRGTAADRADLSGPGWSEIDLVVCNLYPFEATIARPGACEADCVEEIDIGGVALLRAAAKNYARVTVVCDPADYGRVAAAAESGGADAALRRGLAVKAFALCARYDAAIASWLDPGAGAGLFGFAGQALRYGENPHQKAWLYTDAPGDGPLGGRVLQGKELSYNNLLDLDAAWRAAAGFSGAAAVVVKHLSPCGVAAADGASSPARPLAAAIACDPVSAFGGVVAVNRPFDADCALALGDTFVECVAAPSFTPEARELLAKRRNARLLEMGDRPAGAPVEYETRSIVGGFLRQEIDSGDPVGAEWKVVSKRAPTEAELAALRFAWKASIPAKSNSILLAAPMDPDDPAAGFATVGIGSGQPNRVDSARIAVQRAGEKARGSVLASDAFFPFPDSVEVAAAAGVTAIAHPGGSIRDGLSVAAADAAGIAMVVTGVRHFRH